MSEFMNPKVRQYLYGIVTAAVPVLIVYGIVDHHEVTLWLALAAAVLGTGTAVLHTNTKRDPDYVGRHRDPEE